MSGYNWTHGMSNNAVDAYCSGEKPLSKWSKKDILEKIQEVYPAVYGLAKKQTVAALKQIFLYKSSWHHTSKFFNKTYFYKFNEALKIEDITGAFAEEKEKEEEKKPETLFYLDTYEKNAHGKYSIRIVYLNLTCEQLKSLLKEKEKTIINYFYNTMEVWNKYRMPYTKLTLPSVYTRSQYENIFKKKEIA